MPRFHAITFNADRQAAESALPESLAAPPQLRGRLREPAGAAAVPMDTGERGGAAAPEASAEAVARNHLQALLEHQGSAAMTALTSPERPEVMPGLRMDESRDQPLTGTHTVTFHQHAHSVPIFGSRATVELDGHTRQLVAVDGSLADVPDLSPVATLAPAAAAEALARFGGVDAAAVQPARAPELNYYLEGEDDSARWRLVYVFRDVPMPPPADDGEEDDATPPLHCCGGSFPSSVPEYHYLVDAHTGEVVFYYSAVAHLDIPVPCTGADLRGENRTFNALQNGAGFRLHDPLRNISTFDLRFGDIDAGAVAVPVEHPTADFGNSAPAAVSAHWWATRVWDFFNHELKRNGVDDRGMRLESVVNCFSASGGGPPPKWANAAWWRNRMWYGQMPDGNGNHVSTARFADVITHELTHGVTQHTSSLVYRGQSGALNESFSDIFGVMVNNWYPGEPNPLSSWTWSIADGWNADGSMLRSLEDPTLGGAIWPAGRGQPAHMRDYVHTTRDSGGVHVNSGIHNRAAYNVLTATDAAGQPVFSPREVAILYYLTLARLGALATFADCRRTLLNVATTYFSSSPRQAEKLAAIRGAYDAVGIV